MTQLTLKTWELSLIPSDQEKLKQQNDAQLGRRLIDKAQGPKFDPL